MTASLRALLARSVDYAGLFPPARLGLEIALANQATYGCSPEAWMLSTFVLPVAKFADAAWFLSAFDDRNPLRLSALGPKTINEIDFIEELKNARKGIREFSAESGKLLRIEQLEMPLPERCGAEMLRAAQTELGDLPLRCFWEAPADQAVDYIALLGQHNRGSSSAIPFGFKLRTGGVTPDAFPSPAQISRALAAIVEYQVAIKFTAGLHHPVRMHRDDVGARMHGFLNVFGAGVLALEHRWSDNQIAEMLEDENRASFVFTNESFRWRTWQVASPEIQKHRALVTSFGSCSFDEPREDLRALQLL